MSQIAYWLHHYLVVVLNSAKQPPDYRLPSTKDATFTFENGVFEIDLEGKHETHVFS